MSSYFITGTDTDVGKTVITALLAAYFRKQQKQVLPYKPVQSGGIDVAGNLVAPDVELYQLAIPTLNEGEANTYLFKMPSSPHLAAKEEKVEILPMKIIDHFKMLEQKYDTVLVEGAGGLIVPLQETGYCMLQLIQELSIPVILVARAGVGTINHTVLSVMALRAAGIEVAGIILNRLGLEDLKVEQDNKKMIELLTEIPVIGTVPYLDKIEDVFRNSKLLDKVLASFQFERLRI
ncbi:dethiobiotin synthase [Neobacillus sp. LXY-4]|uniref:dethiobiotin synthase n=1 Tax=Neobacillus sp. LXY-4 TaxID=3379826 RepID=UPI003EE20617